MVKDLNVRNTIHSLRKDIVIMKGARPSLLTPSVVHQRSRFLKEMCHRMDIVSVTLDIFVLILWWPDLSGSRHLRPEAMAYFEDVLRILQLLVKAVAWKLENDFPGQFGLSEQQALGIQSWYTSLPLVGQLKPLLEKLSLDWNTPDRLNDMPPTFSITLPELDVNAGPLSAGSLEVGRSSADPFEAGPSTLDDRVSSEVSSMINSDDAEALLAQVQSNPSVTVSDLSREWSKGQAARYILTTKERRPLYDYLSKAEQVQELVQTVQADKY
ncbi:hypothetical protein Unana1_01293 [Umbelopsis nana]